jgi:hypothetical protein
MGLPSVKLDGKFNAVALKPAQAMAASGSVSHSAAGSFFLARGAVAQVARR